MVPAVRRSRRSWRSRRSPGGGQLAAGGLAKAAPEDVPPTFSDAVLRDHDHPQRFGGRVERRRAPDLDRGGVRRPRGAGERGRPARRRRRGRAHQPRDEGVRRRRAAADRRSGYDRVGRCRQPSRSGSSSKRPAQWRQDEDGAAGAHLRNQPSRHNGLTSPKARPTRPTAAPHLHSWARFAAGDSAVRRTLTDATAWLGLTPHPAARRTPAGTFCPRHSRDTTRPGSRPGCPRARHGGARTSVGGDRVSQL